ncbi:ribbon-helix-helix protein, CopG family [Agrobacterium rhizogenes]|uniref:CopG family ribbon-helix-helix protein n=1 Tax=Rhizobium rhizogenes TaxID=359 RepID=UPI00115ECC91|nr:ribbon-helix-helix domain-containing protein [Rhizobium rhizogenes]NTI03137.1 ribbon-helix-helix protein, CopG family [Rhizobium rhizogenes]NTI09941.1 ribbon-helix-helix protein, CopG family [Rhizobium rhizogenes]TRB21534.1 ribbon-helix-helix protein, CopG family [Rhizobium rhizogenes]
MADSATITIRIPVEMKDTLEEMAQDTRRSRSYLAAEAIASYIEIKSEHKQSWEAAQDDAAAGNMVSPETALAEIKEVLAAAAKSLEAWSFKRWSRSALDGYKNEIAHMLAPTLVRK